MQVKWHAGRQQQKRDGMKQQKKEKGTTTLGYAVQSRGAREEQASN